MVKTTDTKTSARSTSKQNGQLFFSKERGAGFFSSDIETETASPFFIQNKLNIGKPDDHYEREADAMADKVVQKKADAETIKKNPVMSCTGITPITQLTCDNCANEEKQIKEKEDDLKKTEDRIQKKPIFESAGDSDDDDHHIQRKCSACQEEEVLQKKENQETSPIKLKAIFESSEEFAVQRKGDNNTPNPAGIESKLNSSRGGGDALAADTRSFMERAIRANFIGVRIHTDSKAAEMSKDLGAQAFTHGNDIYFGSGKYDTNSTAGSHLLAHELTHTIQQGGAPQAIQQEPDADAPKKTIAEVTASNPTPKGEIKEENGITILINGIRVKANSSNTILDSLEKPTTLPKPGSREENKTKQIAIWQKAAREKVVASLKLLLDEIDKQRPLEEKMKPVNTYSLRSKTGGEAALTGTFDQLVNACLVPKWNSSGKANAFQVEHILDYQIAGKNADDIGNLMLLNASVNNTLGAVMRQYIKEDIEGILTHYNKYVATDKLVTNGEAARKDYVIKANTFGKVVHEVFIDDVIFLEMIGGAVRDPLSKNIVEMKTIRIPDGHFVLKSSEKTAGIILPYSRKNFQVGSYDLTTNGNTNGGIDSITAKEIIKGSPTDETIEPKTYSLTRPDPQTHVYIAKGFGNHLSKIRIKYLSLVEFSAITVDDGLNINAHGIIKAPSPKVLGNTPIEVSLVGQDFSIQKTFFTENLVKKIGPIKIDFAALTLSLSTVGGFGASGTIGFRYFQKQAKEKFLHRRMQVVLLLPVVSILIQKHLTKPL